METMRLRTYQQPTIAETLLREFVRSAGNLPADARQVRDRSELPSFLQRLIINATKGGENWECWSDRAHVWLFVADMSLELSRERGRPVLQIKQYRDDCKLADSANWVADNQSNWRRCTD